MQKLFIKKKRRKNIERMDKCRDIQNNGYSDAHLKERKKDE
jgi:hypothetical protein